MSLFLFYSTMPPPRRHAMPPRRMAPRRAGDQEYFDEFMPTDGVLMPLPRATAKNFLRVMPPMTFRPSSSIFASSAPSRRDDAARETARLSFCHLIISNWLKWRLHYHHYNYCYYRVAAFIFSRWRILFFCLPRRRRHCLRFICFAPDCRFICELIFAYASFFITPRSHAF